MLKPSSWSPVESVLMFPAEWYYGVCSIRWVQSDFISLDISPLSLSTYYTHNNITLSSDCEPEFNSADSPTALIFLSVQTQTVTEQFSSDGLFACLFCTFICLVNSWLQCNIVLICHKIAFKTNWNSNIKTFSCDLVFCHFLKINMCIKIQLLMGLYSQRTAESYQ